MITIVAVSKGQCPFDEDAKKEKPLFEVSGAAFTGSLCAFHLHALCAQMKKPEQIKAERPAAPEPPKPPVAQVARPNQQEIKA